MGMAVNHTMMFSRDRRVALGKSTATKPPTHRHSPHSPAQPLGWYSRGYLPHLDAPGLIQHITFHLADSLPSEAVARMQHQLEAIPEPQRAVERRKRIEELLDSGRGSCLLRHEACARVVENSLMFGDGTRYRLLAWVIMPNHVHALIEQLPRWPLAKIVQSWKRHTAREIHRLEAAGQSWPSLHPLWQRDYWDRFIRNEKHFLTVKRYIENNPVAAGLVPRAEDWSWGSARFGEKPSATRRSQEVKEASKG
jgi:putative transposase